MVKKIVKFILVIATIVIAGCEDKVEKISKEMLTEQQQIEYDEFYENENIYHGEFFDITFDTFDSNFASYKIDQNELRPTKFKNGPDTLGIIYAAYENDGLLIGLSITPKTNKEFTNLRFYLVQNEQIIAISPIPFFSCSEDRCVNIRKEEIETFGPYYPYFLIAYNSNEQESLLSYYRSFGDIDKDETDIFKALTLEVREYKGNSNDYEVVDCIEIEYVK